MNSVHLAAMPEQRVKFTIQLITSCGIVTLEKLSQDIKISPQQMEVNRVAVWYIESSRKINIVKKM